MQTSGTNTFPAAISTADIKFLFASVRIAPNGSCDPVKITGLAKFSSIKLKAEAEYDIVSVPWRITNPSNFE